MDNNTVSGIKFTPTEIQVISCFTDSDACKPSTIAKILNKSIKTIYTHLDKIKIKLDAQTNEGISLFVRKSNQFKALKNCFYGQYIDYYFRETAKKIACKLQYLNLTCNLVANPALSKRLAFENIKSAIRLTGININEVDDIKLISKNASELDSQRFNLFIIHDIKEMERLRIHTHEFKKNTMFICLNKPFKPSSAAGLNVLFLEDGENKQFYKFFIAYLVKNYNEIAAQKEALNFLTEIDNIENNIHQSSFTILHGLPGKGGVKRAARHYVLLFWVAFIAVLAIVGVISTYTYLNSHKKSIYNLNANSPTNIVKIQTNKSLLYSLPPRNNKFTGRGSAFKEIRKHLNKSNIGIITQSITGAGGIGKTQLATEYAYRAIENKVYDSILWVTAETSNSINNVYNEFADKLKINVHGLKPIEKRKIIHTALLEQYKVNKILFVLDNVPKKEDIQEYLAALHKQWPIETKPHILITSRSQHWVENSLILDIFTPNEAKVYAKKYLPNETEQDINNLANNLHFFPLALGQAIGYIKQHTNINDYLELYESKQQQHLDLVPEDTNQYNETLWRILSVALLKLTNTAKEILYISSYLEPDNIQLKLFSDLSIEIKSNAIQELRDYSLITLNKDVKSFKIHRLIQEVIRLTIKENTKWINKATKMAKKNQKGFDEKNRSSWAISRSWLSHITSLSQYMQQNLDKAHLLYDYGKIACYFGLYTLAREYYLEVIKLKENHYKNPRHIELSDTLSELGNIENKFGNYADAKDFLQRSLAIQEAHYQDKNDIRIAFTLEGLGDVEDSLGNVVLARDLLQRTLTIKEIYYKDSSHIELHDTLRKLGYIERSLGNYRKAKKLLQRSLAIIETNYQDRNHIRIAPALHSLGNVENRLGNYAKAKDLLQRSLAIKEAHYQDKNNIQLMYTLGSLGDIENKLGNYADAKDLLQRSLAINEAHNQDNNHIRTACTLNSLGDVEHLLGHYVAAKQFYEKVLKIRHFNDQNPNHIVSWITIALYNLGLTEEGLGNYIIALEYLNKSYDIQYKHHRDRLHEIIRHIYSPVRIWPKLSKEDQDSAIKHYQKGLVVAQKLFGKNHHFVARYHYMLGQAYEENKKYKKAIEQYVKSFEIAKQLTATINNEVVRSGHQRNITLVENKIDKLKNGKFAQTIN